MKATLISSIAAALASAALAVSLACYHKACRLENGLLPPSVRASGWTDADEAAVAVLMGKSGTQLGGYMSSLKRGTARHNYTEAQIQEALSRMRRQADWKALTNTAARFTN